MYSDRVPDFRLLAGSFTQRCESTQVWTSNKKAKKAKRYRDQTGVRSQDLVRN